MRVNSFAKGTIQNAMVCGLSICFCYVAAPQDVRGRHTPDATSYTIAPWDKDREKKSAEVREFVWHHWQKKLPGSVLVIMYSKEGKASRGRYVFEDDERGTWSMKVIVDRPDLKGTSGEHVEDRVYGIERIEVPSPQKAYVPVPEGSTLSGNDYRLVLKDKEGKQLGRGTL